MIKSCFRLNDSALLASTGGPSVDQLYPPYVEAEEFDGFVITTYGDSLGYVGWTGPVGPTRYQVYFCDRIEHNGRAIYRIIFYGELMATSSEFQMASGKQGRTLYLSSCWRAAAGPHSIMLELPLACPKLINAVLTPAEQLQKDKNFIIRPAFDLSPSDRLKTASWNINMTAGEDAASVGCEVSCVPEGQNPISAYATASPKGSVWFRTSGDIRFIPVQLMTNLVSSGTALAKQIIDFDSPVAVGADNTLYWLGWELHNNGELFNPAIVSVSNPIGSNSYDHIRLLTLGAVRI